MYHSCFNTSFAIGIVVVSTFLTSVAEAAFAIDNSRLSFSHATSPDMTRCLPPVEPHQSSFRLRDGFIWFWMKMSGFQHDKKLSIRVISPNSGHAVYAWRDYVPNNHQRNCIVGSFGSMALYDLFADEQLLAQFMYEQTIMLSVPFNIYTADSSVVLRSYLGIAKDEESIKCDFKFEENQVYVEQLVDRVRDLNVFFCIDIGHNLTHDNAPFTFEYMKVDDGVVLSTYRNAGEHINGMVLYMPIKASSLIVADASGGKFRVKFSYNGEPEGGRNFTVNPSEISVQEQDFWEDEQGLSDSHKSAGVFGRSEIDDIKEDKKIGLEPRKIVKFCARTDKCSEPTEAEKKAMLKFLKSEQ